ncbi:MAG: hypothetical protein IKU41_07560 [Clostridia bacterium]|nr:hypothetical protein [Clostridia bacterium]
MRNFRIVAMAYEETTPENERNIRKAVNSLVMKIKSPEETVMLFGSNFDEKKIKEKLEEVREVCEKKEQNLGVVVFKSLKYNPANPQEYDLLFCDLGRFAREYEITFVVLLQYDKPYYSLDLQDFQAEYGYDGGIEQDIELLISLEPMHPDSFVARVLKNRCGSTGNYLAEI